MRLSDAGLRDAERQIQEYKTTLNKKAQEFAKALGVTRKTVYNWMVHGNIPQSKLEKMAEMFDCSIDYLLQRSI